MWDKKAKLWRRIKEELSESYVIVEGKKDVEALARIGIRAHSLSHGAIAKAEGKVVILTDLDREGERLAKATAERLKENPHVERINRRLRRVIGGLLSLTRIEEIDKKFRKFKEEVIRNGENIH